MVRVMDIYIALVHHPILNRDGGVVTTAVTNQDIHDLARTARTYDVAGTLLVTPIAQQRALVSRIIAHWRDGEGAQHQPKRAPAFERLAVVESIEEAARYIEGATGDRPELIGTTARVEGATRSYEDQRRAFGERGGSALLLFGTGWGLPRSILDACDTTLPPIEAVAGRNGYNHLSVRAAVAIILDRLLGARDPRTEPVQ